MVAISIKETLFTARLRIISSFCKGPRGERRGMGVTERTLVRAVANSSLAKSFLREKGVTHPLNPPPVRGTLRKRGNALWQIQFPALAKSFLR